VKLNVAGDGKTLKFIGPAESCNRGSGGFSPVSQLHGRIKKVKIDAEGAFKGSAKYTDTHSSAYHPYNFNWDIAVKGRFPDKDTATGRVTFHLTIASTRGADPIDCGERSLKFSAKRGAKWPGFV
jgi:hypothetical protein